MRTLQRTVRETNSPVRDDAPPATRGRTLRPSARPGARGAATRKSTLRIESVIRASFRRGERAFSRHPAAASNATSDRKNAFESIGAHHFFSSFFLSEGRMRFGGSRMRRASTERTRTTLLWIAALMQ